MHPSSPAVERSNAELWIALGSAFAIVSAYAFFELITDPTPGGPVEHLMGIGGMLLMLFTEFGYMFRKRVKWFKVGSLSVWLSLHIFTGIVGPAMVLFHTTFRFHGLALLSSVMTLLVVASGFLGRYLYTAIPRTVAGTELSREELARRLEMARARLDAFVAGKPAHVQQILEHSQPSLRRPAGSAWNVLLRGWDERRAQRQEHALLSRLDRAERDIARQMTALQRQVRQAERQLVMLGSARRLLGIWHLIHLPLGLTLFGSAFIHIVAVFYYGAAAIQ
jgi:hypothetical protein